VAGTTTPVARDCTKFSGLSFSQLLELVTLSDGAIYIRYERDEGSDEF
jgi:hypothetical protein